ncbi:TetR/AcrR family transcriptional regulator [Bdellovibrio sp. HCB337]|uniref:TetR/AcrR family transcriptional regulator n=1 Tax=Bdellovibrio sp. HCB337 TaxID=3394358 RepID=UPI0039A63381
MKKADKKSEKYFAASRAILEIIEKDGPHKLSHAQISRLSKVSRAWIYEYMGKNKEELIDIASEVFASYFTLNNKSVEPNTPEEFMGLLKQGQDIAFQKAQTEPLLLKLYFRFRGTTTPIGSAIKKYEKHWTEYIAKCLVQAKVLDPQSALATTRAILVLRLGFLHRIATSSTPAKEALDANESMDLVHKQLLKFN